jgi:hypothetical protein
LYYNKHIHDMWMADPFDSSLCKCCRPVWRPFKWCLFMFSSMSIQAF